MMPAASGAAARTRPPDPESATKLLLNFEGSNGQASYTSEDAYAHTLAFSNGEAISNSQAKFGSTSLFIPAGADGVKFQNADSFELGVNDFTFEAWVWFPSNGSSGYLTILDGIVFFSLYRVDSGGSVVADMVSWFIDSSGTFHPAQGNGTVGDAATLNTWHHFAVTRQGSTWRYFFNGVSVGSAFYPQAVGSHGSNNWSIGRSVDNGTGLVNGYLDGMRLVVGQALYTADFTPSTSAPGVIG